jgi:hypothetical protein
LPSSSRLSSRDQGTASLCSRVALRASLGCRGRSGLGTAEPSKKRAAEHPARQSCHLWALLQTPAIDGMSKLVALALVLLILESSSLTTMHATRLGQHINQSIWPDYPFFSVSQPGRSFLALQCSMTCRASITDATCKRNAIWYASDTSLVVHSLHLRRSCNVVRGGFWPGSRPLGSFVLPALPVRSASGP